jgi:hypothetical protein
MYVRTTRTAFRRRTKENEKLEFSTKGLLRYIASVVFEAYKTLATAIPILSTLPISVAPYEHPCNKIKPIRLCVRSTVSQDQTCVYLTDLSTEHTVTSTIIFNNVIRDLTGIM